jgi:hypothetical protein
MAHAQKPDFVFRRNGRVHGSRGVRISGSNTGYTMFRGSVKGTSYPPHSPVSLHFSPVRHRVPSHFNWTLTQLIKWPRYETKIRGGTHIFLSTRHWWLISQGWSGRGMNIFFYILQSWESVKGYACMTQAVCRRSLITDVCVRFQGIAWEIFGGFAKLRKATISFVMSVRLSVRPHRTTRLPLDWYSWISILEHFFTISRENSSWIEIWQR